MSYYAIAGVIGLSIMFLELLSLVADWRRALRVMIATFAIFASIVTVLYILSHGGVIR